MQETHKPYSGLFITIEGGDGAGKTTLISGIAAGLGVLDYVTSPTFILINEYHGKIPFYHIDLYRLENKSEIEDLGISEYFSKGGVVAIEWAEKMGNLLPPNTKYLKIEPLSENERKITWQS